MTFFCLAFFCLIDGLLQPSQRLMPLPKVFQLWVYVLANSMLGQHEALPLCGKFAVVYQSKLHNYPAPAISGS
jgi:hypothetical protein